jgi:murein L,D-transpeptidase YafK
MKNRDRILALLILVSASVLLMPQTPPSFSASADDQSVSRSQAGDVNKTPLQLPLIKPRITVRKGKRELTLFANDKPVRVYTVGLGFTPAGDKVRQGDGRTPEGSFYVCVKNDKSHFYLSLGLSYPNQAHTERGLREGLITRGQYNEIIGALQHGERPLWDTELGGEIFIHGNGAQEDWTAGCVALDDENMKVLFDIIPKGTPVLIEP